jgi:membrane protease YdiL (CAAX protease family)
MVFAFASSASSSGIPAAPEDASMVIILTFIAAAVVFAVSWSIRAATKPPAVPSGGQAATGEPAATVAAGSVPFVPVTGIPDSPYAPPATSPPPLPVTEATPVTRGLFGGAGVRVDHYRLLDLPLIGLVFLVYFGLTAMPGGGGEEIPLDQKFRPDVLVASIFFQLLLMGMVAGFVVWRVKLADWLGLRWRTWPLVLAIAPLTVFFMWCFMGALHLSGWNAWLERSLGIESMQKAVKLLQEAKDPLVVVLMAVAAVIVAPVAEEVVFRGYLYPAAKRFCGPAGAIVFSSLVFAAAHGNVVALLPLFALAVILCLLYEFTGSIWACISVHFLFNAATVALQLLARSGVVEIPAPE